ncbi:LysR family transcriptional regulator [Salmonella enterica subsp. salamae]|uniref:LysR family transcriptional regulator n=3 Tax=Salmonella enterica TaxID=28901 RepID=A0A379QMF8_SALER|nr:LysR family transcriptional regulator [Salmonella enterica]ECC1481898.1 LysR family transcriptional regulator [Salmonella enterica subsp. salamae]HCM2000615.1 LysR family transcriptional regulator [Salmonella enterica subsp. salamae serovar [1],40:z35:e,n,x,z15]ASG89179.1 LysR family transcriptional regulator [Salmonella enterica subsp. salamae serovar 55:k:z39 str. 1315K]ECC1656050.1 LysR family transcriptional regulator [Salmonella enterica subsp. salamae]ECD9414437.1 LysR family transcri
MANLYDLKKFDLNLLVIFECIYQHLSISKAAETLYITPSAVSQSLQRLRMQFNDPLFIRSGKGITPTVTGVNLHYHLENNLNSLEQTINIMNQSALRKKFVIYSPQLLITKNVMKLIPYIRKDAHIEIEHHDLLATSAQPEDLLAYRKADIIISLSPLNNRSIVCTHFNKIDCVLVCSENHPRLSKNATLEAIREEAFTQIISSEPGVKEHQRYIDSLLPERIISFRSESLITIANTISVTDLIGFLPKMVVEYYNPIMKLKKLTTSFDIPAHNLYLMYNKASLNNNGFAELIAQIKKIMPHPTIPLQ